MEKSQPPSTQLCNHLDTAENESDLRRAHFCDACQSLLPSMSLRVAHVALLCFLPYQCSAVFPSSALLCVFTVLCCVSCSSLLYHTACVSFHCSVLSLRAAQSPVLLLCCSVSRLHVSQCHPPVGTRAIVWHRSRPIRHCNIISFVFPPIPPIPPRPHPATQLPGCALSIALYQSVEPEIFG